MLQQNTVIIIILEHPYNHSGINIFQCKLVIGRNWVNDFQGHQSIGEGHKVKFLGREDMPHFLW